MEPAAIEIVAPSLWVVEFHPRFPCHAVSKCSIEFSCWTRPFKNKNYFCHSFPKKIIPAVISSWMECPKKIKVHHVAIRQFTSGTTAPENDGGERSPMHNLYTMPWMMTTRWCWGTKKCPGEVMERYSVAEKITRNEITSRQSLGLVCPWPFSKANKSPF